MKQREIALDILYKSFKDSTFTNLYMRKKLNELPSIQRSFCTELINGVLRKYYYLLFQVKEDLNKNTSLKNKIIIAMALYERFFMQEKDYVVNNEYVSLCTNKYDKSFINALLRKTNKLKESDKPWIVHSIDEWLYNLLKKQYDAESLNKILTLYDRTPNVYYRLNRKKCSYADLRNLNIEKINERVFTSKTNLLNSEEYKLGYFYIQDINSAELIEHLDVDEDCNFLDVCAAPGGKLFNAIDYLSDDKTYANDLHLHRLELIKRMANRLGFLNINYLNIDATKIDKNLDQEFKRILVDAPCSGLGVIGRKPDLRYHIKPEDLDNLQVLQDNILNSSYNLLENKGILLYSTCTLNKKENERLVQRFIDNHEDASLMEQATIINDLGDAFYYAKIMKV